MVLKAGLLVLKCGDKCYCQDACLTGCSMKGTCFFWQIGSGNSTGLGQPRRHIPNGSTVSFRNLQNQMIHAHSLENQVVLKCLYKHITICHI